jgi:hypothetical protein
MILPEINNKGRSAPQAFRFIAAAVVAAIFIFAGVTADAALKQKVFATPEDAVKAVMTAARNNDDKGLIAIFGQSSKDLIFSGDAVADKERREKLLSAYDEKNGLVPKNGDMVFVIGKDDWPFPIPLVKKGEVWSFDTNKGREEILNRRIVEHELDTIQTLLADVDDQREYAIKDLDGDGVPEYALKFMSDTGKKNGLYWKTNESEDPSPLGDSIAGERTRAIKRRTIQFSTAIITGY